MIIPKTVEPYGQFWAVRLDDTRLIPFMVKDMAAEVYHALIAGETKVDDWEIVKEPLYKPSEPQVSSIGEGEHHAER